MKKIQFSEILAQDCEVRPGVIGEIWFQHLRGSRETLFGVVSLVVIKDNQPALFPTTAFDVGGNLPADLSDDEVADFIERNAAEGLKLLCRPLEDGRMHFEIEIAEGLTLQGRIQEDVQVYFQTQLQHTEQLVSTR